MFNCIIDFIGLFYSLFCSSTTPSGAVEVLFFKDNFLKIISPNFSQKLKFIYLCQDVAYMDGYHVLSDNVEIQVTAVIINDSRYNKNMNINLCRIEICFKHILYVHTYVFFIRRIEDSGHIFDIKMDETRSSSRYVTDFRQRRQHLLL